jgi:hypothetical protein
MMEWKGERGGAERRVHVTMMQMFPCHVILSIVVLLPPRSRGKEGVMRSLTLGLALFLLVLPHPVLADELGFIRLSLLEGDVQVLVRDTTDWIDAVVNLPMGEGDRLWVPDDAKIELQVRGGVIVRADGNTSLDVLTVSGDSAQFYLDRGHAYVNDRRGGIATVQIDTLSASFRSYDNSIMMIDVTEDGETEDGETEVSVIQGYVYAENRNGATRVTAGETLTIRGEGSADLSPIGMPDEWERWNKDRDLDLLAESDSSRYLPEELKDYASELDGNGQWQYASSYGYVWTPTAVVSTWAPYTVGRWVWVRGSYVWIAYDPWCWAPSHFGRWIVVPSLGWSWVPPAVGAAYWGPGYVGWVVTPTAVAWVPLAPGEIYYGYGSYGPWSRNITTVVNVTNVVNNRVYINARANHGVTVVDRDSFGSSSEGRGRPGENPFIDRTWRDDRHIAIVPPRDRPPRPVVLAPPRHQESEHHVQPPPKREGSLSEQQGKRFETPPAKRESPSSVRPLAGTPADTPPAVKQPRIDRTRVQQDQRLGSPPGKREVTPAVGLPDGLSPGTPPAVKQPRAGRVRPPDQVRQTRPEQLKTERRVVKERGASVFHPQPPENLAVKRLHEPREIKRSYKQSQGTQTKSRSGQGQDRERQQQGRQMSTEGK